MATSAPSQPVSVLRSVRDYRVESIDVLRGLLLVLMAIDHARDYFSNAPVYAADPVHAWPALFLTRWITHLCAPGFIFLAGTSVYLQRQRKTPKVVARTLLSRGLWLVLLELTVINFGWQFTFGLPIFQVIWVIGMSMILLAALQWLPSSAVAALGIVICSCSDLLDRIHAQEFVSASTAWKADAWMILHERNLLLFHGHPVALYGYPLLPWVGVMMLGYGFGRIAIENSAARERLATLGGAVCLALFAVLRLTHAYGDPGPGLQHLQTPAHTLMSFFSVEKYPPSLHYLLATLGCNLLLFALFDLAVTKSIAPRLRSFLRIFGRVPFFFYVLHIFLIHTLALLVAMTTNPNWRFWISPDAVFLGHFEGWGYTLPVVYLVWASVVLALYPLCLWFSRYKDTHRDWWLSYL